MLVLLVTITSCSKNDAGTNSPSSNTPTSTSKPYWMDSLARKWVVKKATYNGNNDPGSIGFSYEFKKDGTYDFDNGRFAGTWKFQDSTYKKFLLDENNPNIGKSSWTASFFTSKNLTVDYTSPITGGKVHWDLESQ